MEECSHRRPFGRRCGIDLNGPLTTRLRGGAGRILCWSLKVHTPRHHTKLYTLRQLNSFTTEQLLGIIVQNRYIDRFEIGFLYLESRETLVRIILKAQLRCILYDIELGRSYKILLTLFDNKLFDTKPNHKDAESD